jgi:hypothetical protein
MTDIEMYTQLFKFVQQIGSGKIHPEMIINNGKVVKMRIDGQQSFLYNRSTQDTNDNTQAIKHISQRINSALNGKDTNELLFNIVFHNGKIKKVAWNSEIFVNIDQQ